MSSISSSFSSPFGISGELGVGTASILGGNAGTTTNAASITASGVVDESDPFYAISQSINTAKTPTLQALETGALTSSEHNVIQQLTTNASQPTSIPWNANGTEPTTIANMRSYGWIKMVEPTFDSSTQLVSSATYELTPIGKAIATRTGGSGVSSGGVSITA